MIFDYLCYKEFTNDFFSSQSGGGRGQYKKLADYLGVSTVVISQTFKGERDLTAENAFKISKFLKLNPQETSFFLKLVEYAKAAHFELKDLYLQELKSMKKKSKEVKSKYSGIAELSDEEKFEFYSEKLYSAIRMASSLPNYNEAKDFADYFNIPEKKAQSIIDFLLKTKLCAKEKGVMKLGVQHTFVPANSRYIKNHHKNWRVHSLNRIDSLNSEEELMYTAPFSMSVADYKILRERLLKVIEETIKLIGPSKEETIACLTIDLLKI